MSGPGLTRSLGTKKEKIYTYTLIYKIKDVTGPSSLSSRSGLRENLYIGDQLAECLLSLRKGSSIVEKEDVENKIV